MVTVLVNPWTVKSVFWGKGHMQESSWRTWRSLSRRSRSSPKTQRKSWGLWWSWTTRTSSSTSATTTKRGLCALWWSTQSGALWPRWYRQKLRRLARCGSRSLQSGGFWHRWGLQSITCTAMLGQFSTGISSPTTYWGWPTPRMAWLFGKFPTSDWPSCWRKIKASMRRLCVELPPIWHPRSLCTINTLILNFHIFRSGPKEKGTPLVLISGPSDASSCSGAAVGPTSSMSHKRTWG